jgi:hypothetical protein
MFITIYVTFDEGAGNRVLWWDRRAVDDCSAVDITDDGEERMGTNRHPLSQVGESLIGVVKMRAGK